MFSANTSQVAANAANYIEDVFSTWLYTGNGSTQTITNGIDLAGKGGLTWIKARTQPSFASNHTLFDTVRGTGKQIYSDATLAQATDNTSLTAFNGTGFTLGSDSTGTVNWSGHTFVSWTFREQAKFFDVVTWTGDGTDGRQIPHSLNAVPGCIIIKNTSNAASWQVYHRGNTSPEANWWDNLLILNATNASASFPNTLLEPTSTNINLEYANVNASGQTYVAYLFAHDAGGFGLTGTDNVISCGSFTTDGSGNASVTLGYEPQFWLYKPVGTGGWTIYDTMRGWSQTSIFNLNPNTSGAEGGGSATLFYPTATGFDCVGGALNASATYIYIAIRRGPMKVPTDGTTVFKPLTYTGNGSTQSITGVGFPPSAVLVADRNGGTDPVFIDKLRGIGLMLRTPQTFAEYNNANSLTSFDQNGVSYSYLGYVNGGSVPYVNYMFQRAPSFFDEVCYTGTGSATTQTHNLGVVPEMMIVKRRDSGADWWVYTAATGNTQYLVLNSNTNTATASGAWNNTTPTASVFSVGSSNNVNASAGTFVAYLFATCAGVSKVGSYTGNGSTQTIDCGFTGGARFVLIKRTDDFSGWYVYDTARGMTTLTDPYLLLNSTAAESATLGSVTTVTTGFAVNASILAAINTNGASYIFLAIA